MNIENAVKSNDKLSSLVALRDKIAVTIDECDSGRDIAALSKRLMEVMDEISEIEKSTEVKSNPLARRREKRGA